MEIGLLPATRERTPSVIPCKVNISLAAGRYLLYKEGAFTAYSPFLSYGKQLVRICLVITELDPGGAERALVHLACGLQDRNIAVFVISLKPLPSAPGNELVRQLKERDIGVTSLNIHNMVGFLKSRTRLRLLLRDHQPDIVQSFLHHANILCAMCRSRQDGFKLVAGYRVADPGRWRAFLERRYRRCWDHFCCVSDEVAEDLFIRLQLEDGIVTTIPNGVDIHRFKDTIPLPPASLGSSDGRRLLGIIGRLDPQKGLEQLLPHLSDLLDNLPGHDLVIAGEGPLRNKLQGAINTSGLGDRVTLAGWIQDIPGFLASIEALLLPSLWEGMPNVVLEAMAAGLPVVAFRVQGITELLGDKPSPQLAEPGDYTTFCQNVAMIAGSPEMALDLGHTNAIDVTRFSIPAMVDRYTQLYQALSE